MIRIVPAVIGTVFPLQVMAQEITIVTDIAPVHSLVAQVAEGVAEPTVLVAAGASPHDFQFTFEQAQSLQDANVVIWVGPSLTPWLADAVDTLSGDIPRLTLLDTDGWTRLDMRDDIFFAGFEDDHDHSHGGHSHGDHDDHGHDDHGHDDHGHDDHGHDDHAHDDHAHDDHGHDDHAHDDHAHDDHGHDDHAHAHGGGTDPHAWLDPAVASAWIDHIAATLTQADPANGETYATNAAAAKARLDTLTQEVAAKLDTVPTASFVVPHDAYQYFEARFERPAIGAIALSDAQAPSPDQIADLQALVRAQSIGCVLNDPQSRSEWVDLVREGTDAKTALADPVGGAIPLGPDHYAGTILAIADAFVDCLTE